MNLWLRRLVMSAVSVLCGGGVSLAAGDFSLQSDSFAANGVMPLKYTMANANVSPGLQWGEAPAGTRSLVLVCIDQHPIAHRWVHWLVIDIDAKVTALPENASGSKMPEGAVELLNSFGNEGYGGPFPPVGTGIHRYDFTIYALNVAHLDLNRGRPISEKSLLQRLEGKIIAQRELIGYYGRD